MKTDVILNESTLSASMVLYSQDTIDLTYIINEAQRLANAIGLNHSLTMNNIKVRSLGDSHNKLKITIIKPL